VANLSLLGSFAGAPDRAAQTGEGEFGVPRRLFEEGDNYVLRQAERLTKNFNWRKDGRRPV
jgi:hypothetical protein